MAKAEKKKLSGRKRDERVAAYIFVAPAVILLIAFLVVPMIYTVYFSGFKYQIMRPDAMKFIGFENYQKLFSDKNFWLALKNTVYFTVIVVSKIRNPAAICIFLLHLFQKIKCKVCERRAFCSSCVKPMNYFDRRA